MKKVHQEVVVNQVMQELQVLMVIQVKKVNQDLEEIKVTMVFQAHLVNVFQ